MADRPVRYVLLLLPVVLVFAGVVVADADDAPIEAPAEETPVEAPAEEPADFGTADATFALLAFLFGVLLLENWRYHGRLAEAPRRLFCPWGLLDVLAVLLMFFAWALVGRLTAGLLPPEMRTWAVSLVTGVAGLAMGAAAVLLLNRRYGLWPRDVGLRWDHWRRDLLLAGGLLLLVVGVRSPLAGLFQYLHKLVGEPMKFQQAVSLMLEERSVWRLVVMIVVAVVVAPLWEETLFRGFLQPYLARRAGVWPAIVLTAILFSLIHDVPGSRFLMWPAMVFPLALALGYAYHRTQRLSASILLHVLHNLIPVVVLLGERLGWVKPG